MSKEITPLEAWERANDNTYEYGYEISGDLCYIIETALGAFEIIKEKNIDFKTLKESFSFSGSNKEQCEMYNTNQWQWVFDLVSPGCVNINKDKLLYLTQEQFDLLKEALLNE